MVVDDGHRLMTDDKLEVEGKQFEAVENGLAWVPGQ